MGYDVVLNLSHMNIITATPHSIPQNISTTTSTYYPVTHWGRVCALNLPHDHLPLSPLSPSSGLDTIERGREGGVCVDGWYPGELHPATGEGLHHGKVGWWRRGSCEWWEREDYFLPAFQGFYICTHCILPKAHKIYKLLILQLAMFTYNNVRCGVTECRITSLVVAHGNRTFHIGCGSGMLQCVSVQTHQNKYKHTPAIYCLYKAPSLPGLSPRHQLDQAIPSPPISIETLPNKVLRITRQQAHRVYTTGSTLGAGYMLLHNLYYILV